MSRITKFLILLSWGCVAASLEKPSGELERVNISYLAQAYHTLVVRAPYMMFANEKAIGLYNNLCMSWRGVLGEIVSCESFQPLVVQSGPAPTSANFLPLKNRAADYLFSNSRQMLVCRVLDLLCGLKERFVDANVKDLTEALIQSLPKNDDVRECILKFKTEVDFVMSEDLMCACARAQRDGSNSVLKCYDADFYEFLCAGEQGYTVLLAESLEFFQPFFKMISQADTPLFAVINNARLRYEALRADYGGRCIHSDDHITNIRGLTAKLHTLKAQLGTRKEDAQFVTLYSGRSVDDFWMEVLSYVLQKGTEMQASCVGTQGFVAFLESVGVEPSIIAEFCTVVTQRLGCGTECHHLDKNTTYYKFVSGVEIKGFVQSLIDGPCICTREGSPPDHLLQYMGFLVTRSGTNWWEVLDGLQESGCQYGKKGDQYLDTAWAHLVSARFDLADVCAYLSLMEEKLAAFPQDQARLVEIVCKRINLRCGACSIWAEDRGVKWMMGKLNSALHAMQGYRTPDIKIVNVDITNVDKMIALMDRMIRERSVEFLQLVVKCLPEKTGFGVPQGVGCLEEGTLYRGLLEGHNTLHFLMNIVSCKDRAHTGQERQIVYNVLTEYLQRLGFKLLAFDPPRALSDVIQAQSRNSASETVPLDCVLAMVKKSKQWRERHAEQAYYWGGRRLSDGRVYFFCESKDEAEYRGSRL